MSAIVADSLSSGLTTAEIQEYITNTRALLSLPGADRESLQYLIDAWEFELNLRAMMRETTALLEESGADLRWIDDAPRLSPPADVAPSELVPGELFHDPDVILQMLVSERQQRITEFEARKAAERERDDAVEEAARLRGENTVIVGLVRNPHFRNEAPVIFRTVLHYARAKERGDVDERGFARVKSNGIGDDFEDVDHPIRNRATVKRYWDKVTDLGLMEREIRPVMDQAPVRGPDGRILRGPDGRIQTRAQRTESTWVKFTGDSVIDMLQPFSLFRGPAQTTGEEPAKPKHGGDRRSERFKATRTPCPECGSTERQTYCKECGSNISETVEAEEQERAKAGFNLDRRESTVPVETLPPTAFQVAAQENVSSSPIKLETCSSGSIGEAWRHGQPLPQPTRSDLAAAKDALRSADLETDRAGVKRATGNLTQHMAPLARSRGRSPVPKPGASAEARHGPVG